MPKFLKRSGTGPFHREGNMQPREPRPRVLVIDRSSKLGAIVTRALRNTFEIWCVSSCVDADAAALRADATILIRDLDDDAVHSPRTAAILRDADPHDERRAILITDVATSGWALVPKPLDSDELRTAVDQVLAGIVRPSQRLRIAKIA
jgi:hypothetical protein